MRENSGRPGRLSTKLKAALAALVAVFAVTAVSATSANANDGTLKLTFDKGQIAVLPELLGPIEASPPAGNPVSIDGALAESGAFSATKEGFNFPTQRIDLPSDEPLIASILGPHVDIILGATDSFTGGFDRSTGAFNGNIPLSLTLQFDPPSADLACALPFNLAVNTTGTLVFPGAGEGGSDLSFPAAPFASPSRDGAVYGSWPAVKFADIQNAPPMDPSGNECAQLLALLPGFIPDWPEGLDGLAGEIWLGGNATVTEAAVCPPGQTGTPPNCAGNPAKVGQLKVTKKVTVKAGKAAKIKITVKNTGGSTLKGKVKLKSSKKQVKVAKNVAFTVGAGKSVTKTVKVKTTKKAKGKANITATIGGKKAKSVVTVKAAKKRK